MKDTPWYKKQSISIALLILFFPLGLFLMWKYTNWNKKLKLVITAILVSLFILVGSTSDTSTEVSSPSQDKHEESTNFSTIEPSEQPTQEIEVIVTSQIVKKVNGKYRYFFDIRNKSNEDFEGSVTISLYNSEQNSPLAKETFNTKQAIEPTFGSSVFLDAHTGPESVHGSNGLSKFKFVINVNGSEVNSGEGEISGQLENLDF